MAECPANTEAIWKGFGLCGLPLWAEILQVQWDGRAKTRRKSSIGVGTNGCSDSGYGLCIFFFPYETAWIDLLEILAPPLDLVPLGFYCGI